MARCIIQTLPQEIGTTGGEKDDRINIGWGKEYKHQMSSSEKSLNPLLKRHVLQGCEYTHKGKFPASLCSCLPLFPQLCRANRPFFPNCMLDDTSNHNLQKCPWCYYRFAELRWWHVGDDALSLGVMVLQVTTSKTERGRERRKIDKLYLNVNSLILHLQYPSYSTKSDPKTYSG